MIYTPWPSVGNSCLPHRHFNKVEINPTIYAIVFLRPVRPGGAASCCMRAFNLQPGDGAQPLTEVLLFTPRVILGKAP